MAIWDNNNNKPLYLAEKEAQDTINEKPFSQLELPEDFDNLFNKRTKIDDLPDFDESSIAKAKIADFLINKEKEYLALVSKTQSTSDKTPMKGIERYGMASVLA